MELDTNNNISLETLVSSEVHSVSLVSSNTSLISDCTSLGVNEIETENLLLDELADLLVETYLENKNYGKEITT